MIRNAPDLLLLLALTGILALGCGPQSPPAESGDAPPLQPEPAGPAEIAPADEPASTAAEPVPTAPPHEDEAARRAMLTLEEVPPPVDKPTNKPYDKPLPDSATKALAEARELREKGNYPEAINKLERALGFDPDNPDIHRLLGLTYVSLPNYGKAAEHLNYAAEYFGDDVATQVVLGRLAMLRNDPDDAMIRFRKALAASNADLSDPQTAYALLVLGRLLRDRGYYTAALQCYDRLEKGLAEYASAYTSDAMLETLLVHPEQLMTAKAAVLLRLARPAEALPLLRRSFSRDRGDEETAELLIRSLLEKGESEEAVTFWRDLAEIEAQHAQMPDLADRLVRQTRNPALPNELWAFAMENNLASEAMALALASSAAEIGNEDAAQQILTDLMEEGHDPSRALLLSADLARRGGKNEVMLRRLAQSLDAIGEPQPVSDFVDDLDPATLDEETLRELGQVSYQHGGEDKYAMHYVMGLLARHGGRDLLAADHFKRSIEANKDFAPAYEALLEIHLHTADEENLKVLLELSREAAEEGPLYNYMLGRARLSQGRIEEAIAALEDARKQKASHLPTLVHLAEAYRLQADLSESQLQRRRSQQQAAELMERILVLQPDRLETYRNLFEMYVSGRDFHSALNIARRLMRQRPDVPDGQVMAAEVLIATGDYAQASFLLDKLIRENPDDLSIRLLAIRSEVARLRGAPPKEQFDHIVSRLEEIIRRNPESTDAREMLAEVLTLPIAARHDRAAEIWADLYEADRNYEIGKKYAISLLRSDRPDRAAEVIEAMLEERGGDLNLRILLADSYVRSDRLDQAIARAESWRRADPDDLDLLQVLLDLYREAKRYDRALELAEELGRSDLFDLPAARKAVKLDLLIEAGMIDEAVRLVEADDVPLIWRLMFRLTDIDRYEQAYRLMDEYLRQAAPPAAGLFEDAANELRELKIILLGSDPDPDRALKQLDAMLEETRESDLPPEAKGERLSSIREAAVSVLISAGEYDRARKRLGTYLRKEPNNAELHNMRATLLGEAGDIDEARAELEKALQLEGDDSMLKNNLAYLLADYGLQLDRAETLIDESLEAFPESIASLDTLGWVYYKQGRLSQAAEVFLRVLPAEPDRADEELIDRLSPVIWDHAGDVMYRLGWEDRAERYWREALNMAREEKSHSRENRMVLEKTSDKIEALEAGEKPEPAPLAEPTTDD